MAASDPAAQKAVKLYEKVLKQVSKQNYQAAGKTLDNLAEKFPDQEVLLERVAKYQRLCKTQQQAGAKIPPKAGAEQLYDQGIIEHNQGNYDRAVELFEKALKAGGDSTEDIHVALAASEVCRGNSDAALSHVKKSLELDGNKRFLLLHDPDLEPLRSNEKFRKLVNA